MEERGVCPVSLREAWLDHRLRRGVTSPNSRTDLMRAIMGAAYDLGLLPARVSEHFTDDEPRFAAVIIDPRTRVPYEIQNVPYDLALTFLRVLASEGKGGESAAWEHLRLQFAGECGLN